MSEQGSGRMSAKVAPWNPQSLPICLEGKKEKFRRDRLLATGTNCRKLLQEDPSLTQSPELCFIYLFHLPTLPLLLFHYLTRALEMVYTFTNKIPFQNPRVSVRAALQDIKVIINDWSFWRYKPQPFASTYQGSSRSSHWTENKPGKKPSSFLVPPSSIHHKTQA